MDIEVAAADDTVLSPARKPGDLATRTGELAFRSYRLEPENRLLIRDGEAVEIGGRAFDLLLVLLRSRGNIVGKNEIFENVWPAVTVEESNLRFQMAQLRNVLGPDRDVIKTVKGRGYLLAAETWPANRVTQRIQRPTTLGWEGSRATEALGQDGPSPAAGNGGPGRHPFIAVVDDDDATREALDGLIRSTGAQVELFACPADFMKSPDRDRALCLILDVWMPGRSGLEFQEDLAQCGITVPIIFISGHADVQTSVRAMKAGAIEFLTKPVRYQDLLTAIDQAVSTTIVRH